MPQYGGRGVGLYCTAGPIGRQFVGCEPTTFSYDCDTGFEIILPFSKMCCCVANEMRTFVLQASICLPRHFWVPKEKKSNSALLALRLPSLKQQEKC